MRVWIEKLKEMRHTYEEKCRQFWRKEIDANQGDSRRLWRALNGVMGATSGVETGQTHSYSDKQYSDRHHSDKHHSDITLVRVHISAK